MTGDDTAPVTAIFDAIDKHDDGGDDPARISDVVDDAVLVADSPSAVFEAFASMFKRGDVYETKPGHVRRTAGTRDTDGADE